MEKRPINNLLEMYCKEIKKHVEDKKLQKEDFCKKNNITEKQYENIISIKITALSINLIKNIIKKIKGIK